MSMKTITYLLLYLLVAVPARGELIDGIAATAGGNTFTIGEIITESKIRNIIQSGERSLTLPVEGSFSRELLDQAINTELIFQEAKRLNFESGKVNIMEDMLAMENAFRDTREFSLFLEQEGLHLDDVVENLTKKEVVADFVAERISLMSYVSSGEIEDYYKENPDVYGRKSLKTVEKEIKKTLEAKKGAQFLDRWLEDLRKREEVKYLDIPQEAPLP